MRTSDFDYHLPSDLIAQVPIRPRDHARLMVLSGNGTVEHRRFFEITDYLRSGDVIVLNRSRVIPARLWGRKADGGARIELLLLNLVEPSVWEALAKPGRRIRAGTVIEIGPDDRHAAMTARIESKTEHGTVMVRLTNEDMLETLGDVPLPPYIHTRVEDPEDYQTVYALTKGSVAAPTAGFHFTPELLEKIILMGVEIVYVTLHVGLGSFRPVKAEDPVEHDLHHEYYEVNTAAARQLNEARQGGRRIIAVGTTSVRALEGVTHSDGMAKPFSGWNDLYILPGYEFRMVDALITNFHLPRSTLLMLVSAFAGRERILAAYQEAIRNQYRFYSFGDAMLIY